MIQLNKLRKRGFPSLFEPNLAYNFILIIICLSTFSSNFADTSTQKSSPLVYTKLRHENDFLQLFRNYQNKLTYEERKLAKSVKLREANELNETRQVEYTYYENKQVDSSAITHDDLIVEALDRTYRSRLISAYIYDYDNPEDRYKSSDKKLISKTRCKRDLGYLLANLPTSHRESKKKPVSPELDAFFDSFAGEEPGLLFGNYHWTGNWKQCYRRQIFELDRKNGSNSIAFKGRYCTAKIRSKNWDEKIKRKSKELAKTFFRYPEQQYEYARFFRIQVGFCLPESCDSGVIDWARAEIHRLALHKLNEPYKSYDLADVYCLPDEGSKLRELDFSGKLFVGFCVIWLSLVLLTSCYDMIKSSGGESAANSKRSNLPATGKGASTSNIHRATKSTLDKFVSSMSLKQNWIRLFETKSLQIPGTKQVSNASTCAGSSSNQQPSVADQMRAQLAPNDLLFLNAIKVIGIISILYGHVGMFGQQLDRFPLDFDVFNSDFLFHLHISATFTVDWYFVITGFLTAYMMFISRKIGQNSITQWCYTIFHRYWRLAPMFVLVTWFCQSVFHHTADGPVWDYGTANVTHRAICRRQGLIWPLTLTSNWHSVSEECITPSWYISNDMQFYLVTPAILVLLYKSPFWGWLTSIALIMTSVLLRTHRYATDPRADHLELMRPRFDAHMRNSWDMFPTYLQPQYRIGGYLIGLLTGHYVYMVLSGQWKSLLYSPTSDLSSSSQGKQGKSSTTSSSSTTISKILRSIMFYLGLGIVLSMMLTTWQMMALFPQELEEHSRPIAIVLFSISHIYTSFGVALILIAFMFGHAPGLKRFLSHPAWSLITRLNFIVFLIQIEVIYWLDLSSERIIDFSGREATKKFLTVGSLCYLISLFLTLTLEQPLAYLEREFVGVYMHGNSSKSKQVNSKQSSCEINSNSQQKQHLKQP